MITLGRFTKEYELEEDTFLLVRGLTVAEYIELSQRKFFTEAQVRPSMFIEIAMSCILGWDGIIGDDNQPIGYDMSLLQYVCSEEQLVHVGKFVIEELTIVDTELEEKIKGYIRFTSHVSKDENANLRDSFDCNKCIKSGYWESRSALCKKFTIEDVQTIRDEKVDIKTISDKKNNIARAKDKLRAKRKNRGRKDSQKAKTEVLFMGNYKFPECPISWIDDWIFTAGSVLHHSQASNIPFFSGGLADQPYKLYRISRIIAGESNVIEKEDFESRK